MSQPLLETRRLGVSVGGKQICRDLDLMVRPGERWGILGLNGAGKTTLLHTLGGVRAAASGEVWVDGAGLNSLTRRQLAQRLGLVFQDSDEAFPSTVLEAALIGRHPHLHAWAWENAQDETLARAALDLLGLQGFESRSTVTLSGGERRRLALATLLVQDPQLMLLDEPVNHLDVHHQVTVLELLANLAREKAKALMMVLHDVNLVARFCDRVLLLHANGEVVQGGVSELLTEENLERLYRHPMRCVRQDGNAWFYPA